MIDSITLLGSSSGRNAGDAALISGIMSAIDSRLGRKIIYEIPTLCPDFVTRTYRDHNVRAINVLPWTGSLKLFGLPTLASVKRTSMSLVFDAVLFDRSLYNPMFNFLSSLALLLPAAKRAGKRVGLYNCGVGPITTPMGEKMLRRVSDVCDFICVREEGSRDVLRRIGVSDDRITLTADAALNAPAISQAETDQIMERLGLQNQPEILGININIYLDSWASANRAGGRLTREQFLTEMAQGISAAAQTIKAPILLISTMHKDIPLTQALRSMLKVSQPVVIIDNKEFSHYQLKGIFSRLSLLYAMRLHAIILASSAGAPVAGLAYQPKVRHYFEQLGLQEFCSDFNDFNAASITAFLVHSWNKKDQIQSVIDHQIQILKERALLAAEYVAQYDNQSDQSMLACASA